MDSPEGRGHEREAHPPFSEFLPESSLESRSAGAPPYLGVNPKAGYCPWGASERNPAPHSSSHLYWPGLSSGLIGGREVRGARAGSDPGRWSHTRFVRRRSLQETKKPIHI